METVILAKKIKGELYPITLDEWRRLAKGEDILPEIPETRRAKFLEWKGKAETRRREAEKVMKMFEN